MVMTPYVSWLLVLLCSPLWHSEVVEGWGGLSPAPSESECRPYIEKALKEKEHTPEITQEAVDATGSEQETPPSQSADQEGSIENTQEDITNESVEEKISDETQPEVDEKSRETRETTESREEPSIENVTEESAELPHGEESIESTESQEAKPEEIIGEEKKTEESEEGATEQPSIEGELQSSEAGESLEATSTEDTAAEQHSAETLDNDTKEEQSGEVETKSGEESLEEIKESEASEVSEEVAENKSEEIAENKSEEIAENKSEETAENKSEETAENISEEKTVSEEVSQEEKTSEETIEQTDSSENPPTSAEEQPAEESVESPVGEVTDSLEVTDSEGAKESTETQESIETATAETTESNEGSEETKEVLKEETKDTSSAESSVEETLKAEDVSLEAHASSETPQDSVPESSEHKVESTESEEVSEKIEATPTEGGHQEKTDQKEPTEESLTEQKPAVTEEIAKEQEPTVEDQLTLEFEEPKVRRPRDHIAEILHLTPESAETELLLAKTIETTLKDLKKLYDVAIKPLEILYKYRDLSNRHFGDPEIFSKPLILFMGPWSGGKSTILNYLLDNEFKSSSLRTGAEPSPAYFNLLMWGEREEVLDGTQMAADWTFSGLQKFGQGLLDRLRGLRLNAPLLEKVNIVEIPGILEIRKQVERLFPFNDACQWFIDRADIIFLVYDPSKLDVGPETEAILDQLKGREYQTRIILNKADQVKPEELMRVQGTLIWNISPLMSSQEPPVMYSTSLWSIPYEQGAPSRLLHAQERAFLRDLRQAVDRRVENKISSARRFAVRVRNHAKMVDCYLTTYYNHKTFFGNRKKVADDIIEHPQNYHIYEGLSTLTNISRYDLPDPEVYRDFFRLNPLYDFQRLSDTCTYFRGCPINRLDVAIAYDLPELVGKWKKQAERVLEASAEKHGKS